MSAPKVFLVRLRPGGQWVHGKGSKEQRLWTEHASFIDTLLTTGHLRLGGPLADFTGIILVLRADSPNTVRALLGPDPWGAAGILHVESIEEWAIFADPAGLTSWALP